MAHIVSRPSDGNSPCTLVHSGEEQVHAGSQCAICGNRILRERQQGMEFATFFVFVSAGAEVGALFSILVCWGIYWGIGSAWLAWLVGVPVVLKGTYFAVRVSAKLWLLFSPVWCQCKDPSPDPRNSQ
jgi:hypothetical protein